VSRAKKAAANIADIAAVAGAVLVPSIAASPGVNREVSFADMAAAITGIARRRVASMATTASAVTGHKVISVTSHVTNIARTASVRLGADGLVHEVRLHLDREHGRIERLLLAGTEHGCVERRH